MQYNQLKVRAISMNGQAFCQGEGLVTTDLIHGCEPGKDQ
jgi:hypothetical protein